MKKIGILIVDDSAVMRKAITALIEAHEELYVVGIARNGEDAIEKASRLKPHIILMDQEMPIMNGLTALQQIMGTNPIPVIMLTQQAIDYAQAIAYGAYNVFRKKQLIIDRTEDILELFYASIQEAAETIMPLINPIVVEPPAPIIFPDSPYELLVIGSSTGGPKALQQIVEKIQLDFPVPVLIIQHMPVGFTKALANRFNQLCEVPVTEAESGDLLKKGHIYIAPAGKYTEVHVNDQNQMYISLQDETELETLYKPSIDVALHSIPAKIKANTVTVILTGMGDDGLYGCRQMKKYEGYIIGEHPDSCVIYGMPKVVYDAGLCDVQLKGEEIFVFIEELLR